MQENYTDIDLMQFLYREMPAAEAARMAHRIEADVVLRDEYEALQQAKMQVPRDRFNPSPASIRNILAYSKATAVEAQL